MLLTMFLHNIDTPLGIQINSPLTARRTSHISIPTGRSSRTDVNNAKNI